MRKHPGAVRQVKLNVCRVAQCQSSYNLRKLRRLEGYVCDGCCRKYGGLDALEAQLLNVQSVVVAKE